MNTSDVTVLHVNYAVQELHVLRYALMKTLYFTYSNVTISKAHECLGTSAQKTCEM